MQPPVRSIDPRAFWADPYPTLAAMRAETPVVRVPELGGAILLHEQKHPAADVLLMGQMKAMLEECYWSQLNQLPRQQWAEYFDGPTGTWVGQQARTYQTWTIVGFLLLHHFLRVQPSDVQLLDIGG